MRGQVDHTVRRYGLLLILLLAVVLRLVTLGERNLWYDEAFAVLFARNGLDAMLYGTLTPVTGGAADIHPLLYYMMLDGWMSIVGEGTFAVRLLSVVFGVATVGVVYVLARDLFSRQTGLVAACITAVAPFHVQYSQEARMYSLLALLLVSATWCYVRGARLPAPVLLHGWRRFVSQWGWWVAFGVLAALAMYTQQLAAFYLAALACVPLLTRNRRARMGVIVGAVVAVVLYLPWLVQLPAQLGKLASYYWVAVPNPARLLLTLRAFLVVGIDVRGVAGVYALVGAVFVFVFGLVQVVMTLRRRRHVDRAALLFVLWLFAAPVLLMWGVSQVRPVYLDRALLPSAVMLYVAQGWLFTRSQLPRPFAAVIGVTGLALVGVGLATQYTVSTFPNSPFRDATAYAENAWQDGDLIVHQNKLSALPMMLYARDLRQVFIADPTGSPEDTLAPPTREVLGVTALDCIEQADGERVWFVVFADVLRQAQEAGRTDVAAAFDWLNAHYTLERQERFNDLDVYRFANPDESARQDTCGGAA